MLPPLRVKPAPQPSQSTTYYDPDEVNRKVAAMLAATEALKPTSPAQSTKKQATKSNVFSKVVGFLDRRLSTKSGKGKKGPNDIKPEVETYSTKAQRPSSTEPLHRLGKKTETRTWTPRGLLEHRIPRKPVPNDGLHLQPGGCAIEKETEVGSFIEKRDGKEAEDCGWSQTWIGNPFASEKSFDNLEGFLTTQPIGSSTPKDRRSFDKDWTFGDNQLRDRPPLPRSLSYPSSHEADDELTDGDDESAVSGKKQGKRPAKPTIRLQRASANLILGVDGKEPERVKLHPSPSTASLEELSRQFDALLPDLNNQRGPATDRTGLSPIMAAFPRPPARIPKSETSILSTAEYHAYARTNAKASVPRSPTELIPAAPPTRAPSRRAWQAGEGRLAPRQPASG
ncbi:hypothetical protein IMZ48_43080, partial [Candidatus Bathyarchaeota archaeon]|nr:hypothetical protein [Candidatus Bathyarchaeota archaeon]